MSESYFSIPIYTDNTKRIERVYDNDKSNVFVFLKKRDYSPENKDLLKKILAAVQVNLEENVKLLLLNPDDDAYVVDEMDFSVKNHFFAFGLNAKRLGLQSKTIPYKWMKLDNLSILFSHTLTDLQKNVSYKKRLWGELQKMHQT